MEVSALRHVPHPGLRGPTPFLKLQGDERLIALTRRGNQSAYEALVARYQARLLAFCRHMLHSKEDAEDVLQEVFAAAFNAIMADDRPINVRPWLYRIARNRSLNHLRRQQAIGVDSMDVHLAENGTTTADKVHKREEFRELVGDVQTLPETQRTALLLREIDALSYEQIAEAMETTVPSVKSLLVRARVSLAEAAEARRMTCEEVREELGEQAEGLRRLTPPARRHVKGCTRCAAFRDHLKQNNKALAAVFPVGPLLLLKKFVLAQAGGATAATSAAAGGTAAASAAGAGSALSAGMSAIATKTAAGLAAAALVTAGAVEVDHARVKSAHPRRRRRHPRPRAGAGPRARGRGPHAAAGRPPRRGRAGEARRGRCEEGPDRRQARARPGGRGARDRRRTARRHPRAQADRPAGVRRDPAAAAARHDGRHRRHRGAGGARRAARGSAGAAARAGRAAGAARRAAARAAARAPAGPAGRRPAAAVAAAVSAHDVAELRVRLGRQQEHLAVRVRPEDEDLGAHRPDLARREVHDAEDEPPLQLLARVVRDLRGGALDADLLAEVDAQLPRRAARLGEVLDLDDPPDADVDRDEVVEGDLVPDGHGRSVPKRKERSGVLRGPLAPTASARGTAGERVTSISIWAPSRAPGSSGTRRMRRP